jgi:hypothetical protein
MVVAYFEALPYHLPEGLRTPTRYVTGGNQIPVDIQGHNPPGGGVTPCFLRYPFRINNF